MTASGSRWPAIVTAGLALVLLAAVLASSARQALADDYVAETDPPVATADARPGFVDFRDTLWSPGRYLRDGNNPYDHDAYLDSHEGQQEFNPYAPAWFLLAVPFSMPSFEPAAVAFLVLSGAAAVVFAILVGHVAGVRLDRRWLVAAALGGAALACALQPGRQTLQNGQATFIVGTATLAALAWWRSRPTAAGIALAIAALKPQFGVVVALIGVVGFRQLRPVLVGAAVLVVASVPAAVAAASAAGGLGDWVGSILDTLQYASESSNSPRSDAITRIDLAGVVGELTRSSPPTWLTLLALIGAVAVAGAVLRRRGPDAVGLAVALLAVIVATPHFPYDGLLALAAGAIVAGAVVRGELGRLWWVVVALTFVPAVHDHRIEGHLLDGVAPRWSQSIDGVAIVAALGLATALALAAARAPRPTSAA